MAENFNIPAFLRITDDDRKAQERLRETVDLRRKSEAEKHIARNEREIVLASDTLLTLTQDINSSTEDIEQQQRRLAVALMYCGRFQDALGTAPDAATIELVLKMKDACDKPDTDHCGCAGTKRDGAHIGPDHTKTWVKRNGQIVGVVACAECGDWNAGAKPSKRVNDAKFRDPQYHEHFLQVAKRQGR